MPGFAQALAEQSTKTNGPKCRMAVIAVKLSPADRSDLETALNGDVGGEAIANALTALGHPVHGHTVQRHRNGKCACGPRN